MAFSFFGSLLLSASSYPYLYTAMPSHFRMQCALGGGRRSLCARAVVVRLDHPFDHTNIRHLC